MKECAPAEQMNALNVDVFDVFNYPSIIHEFQSFWDINLDSSDPTDTFQQMKSSFNLHKQVMINVHILARTGICSSSHSTKH